MVASAASFASLAVGLTPTCLPWVGWFRASQQQHPFADTRSGMMCDPVAQWPSARGFTVGAPCRVGHMVLDQGCGSLCASVCRERACVRPGDGFDATRRGHEEEPGSIVSYRAKELCTSTCRSGRDIMAQRRLEECDNGVLRGGLASAPGPLVSGSEVPKPGSSEGGAQERLSVAVQSRIRDTGHSIIWRLNH